MNDEDSLLDTAKAIMSRFEVKKTPQKTTGERQRLKILIRGQTLEPSVRHLH